MSCVPCFIRSSPLKAGYTAPNASPCFSIACRCSLRRSPVAHIGATATKIAGLHERRVVARMPLRIALPPGGPGNELAGSRTPSSSPRLGIGGHHQGRHRCALDGFLGPPSEKVVLTRILRHPKAFRLLDDKAHTMCAVTNHNTAYPSRSTTNSASAVRNDAAVPNGTSASQAARTSARARACAPSSP